MGVVNITPNSFSDGGLHLEEQKLLNTLQNFQSIPNLIIDIGCESTAPMNTAVSSEVEKKRFQFFLDIIKNNPQLKINKLSLDTYKTENFKYFYSEIKKLYPHIEIIFNDVSGVLDSELEKVLLELTDVLYIFTSTRIPDRLHVLDHMKFLDKKSSNIIEETFENFKLAHHWFSSRNLEKRIIFDPGFGFSKSYEENWELIENFADLVKKLESEFIKTPWCIGLSKKSFLRKKCTTAIDPVVAAEELHQKLLKNFLAQIKTEVYFRVHNPEITP